MGAVGVEVALHFTEAVAWAERAVGSQPNAVYALFMLAASYAMAGRLEDAKQAVARILKIVPDHGISRAAKLIVIYRADDKERFLEGLRRAGLPE